MGNLVELFCIVDDFCKEYLPRFEQHLLNASGKTRKRQSQMSMSEVMTIVIHFHQSNFRTFKHFYLSILKQDLHPYFPKLVSYNRMVELMQSAMVPMIAFLETHRGKASGLYFIDSTPIEVCHVKRAGRNKVFNGLAKKTKSTMGWFFGFKLHLVINDKGEIIAFQITSSKTDDRKPVPELTKGLAGKIVGDKGYISNKLFENLFERGLQLITRARKNMLPKPMVMFDKLLLRKRGIVESVIDQLKNISQIEHTRHRSVTNFMMNILSGLAAYALKPKKPSINIEPSQLTIA